MVVFNGIEIRELDIIVSAGLVLLALLVTRFISLLIERYGGEQKKRIMQALGLPILIVLLIVAVYLAVNRFAGIVTYVGIVNKLFVAVLSIGAAFFLLRIIDSFTEMYWKKAQEKQIEGLEGFLPIANRLAKLFVILIAAIIALAAFGVEISPLLASLGILGLAVALAFQETLGNFFSGVYLIIDKPVRLKDYIRTEHGEEGYVESIGWRSTKIRTRDGNVVIIPNNRLAQAVVTNYYALGKKMELTIPVSVAYDSDLEKVEEVTIDVARKIQSKAKGAVNGFRPKVRYDRFGESGIEFKVILQVEEFTDKFEVTHEFIKTLKKRYVREKITIPYPKRDIFIKGFEK